MEGLDLQNPEGDAQIWEKALRKLRGHQMPPPGSPQPMQKDVESFVAWMETTLDTEAKGPKAGYVPIQRLNRTEYAAAVKALVGVDVDAKEVLPQDIQVDGSLYKQAIPLVNPGRKPGEWQIYNVIRRRRG